MDPKLLAHVGLLTAAQAALPDAIDLATRRVKAMEEAAAPGDDKDKLIASLKEELATLKKEKEDRESAGKKAADDEANSLVEAAVADGRIAAGDEATKTKFRTAIAAGNAFAKESLASLGKDLNPSAPVIQVKAGDAAPTTGSRRIEAAEAKARVELGAGAKFEAVWGRAKEIDPGAFND